MAVRFHYEDVIFQQLLLDQLPSEQAETVSSHVETCVDCQDKLETLSQEEISWDQVRSYLNPDEDSPSQLGTTAGYDGQTWADDVVPIGFLKPSENKDAMGRFGRFDIVDVLGRGGMGLVLRGIDTELNRQSAIKVLAPELATVSAARKRFSREAKSAAAVVHEHVVPIQTVDQFEGLPYFVMPVVEGQSLQQRVQQHGPLDLKQVLRIGTQIASGLAAAHAQGLVHRDVKPANILLDGGVERVVITDFGLARAADDASMTRSGVIAGTPQYMSPEQARGESIDLRSDLFSLGSVLYFMCCGHSPFRADTTMGMLHRIVQDTPRSLRTVNPEVPEWLDAIVARLLAKHPADRYQSAAEVSDLLQRWLAHIQDPSGSKPPAEVPSEQDPPASQPVSAAGFWSRVLGPAMLVGGLLGAVVLGMITLNLGNQGTLVIESIDKDIPIQILRDGTLVKQLKVQQDRESVKVSAGQYTVVIPGNYPALLIDQDKVTIERGGEAVVKIVHRRPAESQPPPSEKPPAPGSVAVIDVIGQFNQEMQRKYPKNGQLFLTDQELIAWARWSVKGLLKSPLRDPVAQIVHHGSLPRDFALRGGKVRISQGDTGVEGWIVCIARADETLEQLQAKLLKDPQSLKMQTIRWRSLSSETPELDMDPPEGVSLATALANFNNRITSAMPGHAEISMKELKAAAAYHWIWRQRFPVPVSHEDLDRLMQIAQSETLPKGAEFELMTEFEQGTYRFKVLSARLRLDKADGSGSFAFALRQQFVSCASDTDSIVWGKASHGIQLGVKLAPEKPNYRVGDTVQVYYYFRALKGESVKVAMPYILFCNKIHALDETGTAIRVKRPKALPPVQGAMQQWISPSPSRFMGEKIVIATESGEYKPDVPTDPFGIVGNQPIVIVGKPWQSCRLRFTVASPHPEFEGELTSGIVTFGIEGDATLPQTDLKDVEPEEIADEDEPAESPTPVVKQSHHKVKLRVLDAVTEERISDYQVGFGFRDAAGKVVWSDYVRSADGIVREERYDVVGMTLADDDPALLSVSASGYLRKLVADRPIADLEDSIFEVRVHRGDRFEGRIVDEKGNPVTARVFLMREKQRNRSIYSRRPTLPGYQALIPLASKADTEQGRFTLSGLDDNSHLIAVLPEGRALVFYDLHDLSVNPEGPTDIVLPAAAQLTVKIPHGDEKDYVHIRHDPTVSLNSLNLDYERDCRDDGTVHFEGLAPGRYVVSLMRRSTVRYVRLGLMNVDIADGEHIQLDFPDREGYQLKVKVLGMKSSGLEAGALTLMRRDNHTKDKSRGYVEADESIGIDGDGDFESRPMAEGWYKWNFAAYKPDDPTRGGLRTPHFFTSGQIYIPDDEAPELLEINIEASQ